MLTQAGAKLPLVSTVVLAIGALPCFWPVLENVALCLSADGLENAAGSTRRATLAPPYRVWLETVSEHLRMPLLGLCPDARP